MKDISFRSQSLERKITYRVFLPKDLPKGLKLPVVYLLHGGGGDFREWSNDSDVAGFAENGLILVMPEGESSYYTDSVDRPKDRFEDYIVKDLLAEVEAKYPADPSRRAIAGVSMGGFGAIKLALKHPALYKFAGALSPAIDVPSRPFSIKRVSQYRQHASIFGAWGSQTRRDNDPFILARNVDPDKILLSLPPVVNKRACSPRTETLLRCLPSVSFTSNSTPAGVDTTGINGMRDCQRCLAVCCNT